MNASRSVIVKTLVTTKNIKTVFEFFINVKNWESGGALKNMQKTSDGFWLCDSSFGKVKIKLRSNEEFGILDHDFFVDGGKWTVSCRVTPNESGSTVSWLFIKPESMTHNEFEEQLKNFDNEIIGWKKSLEL